jgi:hypothetical protein
VAVVIRSVSLRGDPVTEHRGAQSIHVKHDRWRQAGQEVAMRLRDARGAVRRHRLVLGRASVKRLHDVPVRVAHHEAGAAIERHQPLQRLTRQRAPRQIPSHHDRVDAGFVDLGENRIQRRKIAVDVVEDGYSHR